MATKMTALRPDDQRRYHDFIRATVDLNRPHIVTTNANKLVLATLHEIEAFSPDLEEQTWARRTLDALAEDGSRNHVDTVVREAQTIIRLPNKAKVSMPARVGVRRHGERPWQQSLWYELTWAEFEDLLGRWESRYGIDTAKLTTMRLVRTLRDRFPESSVVGEALRLAGLDPLELDLAS